MRVVGFKTDEIPTKTIVLDIGDGYELRATRITVRTFDIVTIDWKHPNYGYFADFMLWIKSMHMKDWNAFPVVSGVNYNSVDEFLREYPDFEELFEPTNFMAEIFKGIGLGLDENES